jgi:hypothetical protein
LPLEQWPTAQSESEPHELQWPFEHLLWPLQSESEPQLPHLPLEQWPTLQSESEPQAYAGTAEDNISAAASAASTIVIFFIGNPRRLVRGESVPQMMGGWQMPWKQA